MQDMAVTIRLEPGRVVLVLAGSLDLWHLPVLADALTEATELGMPEILVDASGLTFVDATARRYLTRVGLLAPLDHVDIRVRGLSAGLRRKFEEVGLGKIFDIR